DALVGDADFGKLLFNGAKYKCSTCHSVTPGVVSIGSNLSAVGAKYPVTRTLQNTWLLNRAGGWSPASDKSVVVDLSWKDGRKLSGYLSSASDFRVIIHAEDGGSRIIPIEGGDPKVVIRDRMQAHIDMLPSYSDDDIHDLTAYLASLK
ncbi:MAG: cytochrome c, class, partial [Caulobacteraceae bacterium]|nr:cytochrome c, class [Caulobacteraceae bacterium]